jgi:hypothetical protein
MVQKYVVDKSRYMLYLYISFKIYIVLGSEMKSHVVTL